MCSSDLRRHSESLGRGALMSCSLIPMMEMVYRVLGRERLFEATQEWDREIRRNNLEKIFSIYKNGLTERKISQRITVDNPRSVPRNRNKSGSS